MKRILFIMFGLMLLASTSMARVEHKDGWLIISDYGLRAEEEEQAISMAGTIGNLPWKKLDWQLLTAAFGNNLGLFSEYFIENLGWYYNRLTNNFPEFMKWDLTFDLALGKDGVVYFRKQLGEDGPVINGLVSRVRHTPFLIAGDGMKDAWMAWLLQRAQEKKEFAEKQHLDYSRMSADWRRGQLPEPGIDTGMLKTPFSDTIEFYWKQKILYEGLIDDLTNN